MEHGTEHIHNVALHSSSPLLIDRDAVLQTSYAQAIQALRNHLLGGFDPDSDGQRSRAELRHGTFLFMPAESNTYAGVKVLTATPANPSRGFPLVQGSYLLLDATTHTPLATLDGAAITELRTPAVSIAGVYVPLRQRFAQGVNVVIFGNGVQALGHLQAAAVAVDITHLTVVVRSVGRAATVIAAAQRMGITASEALLGSAQARAATQAAGLVITVTNSSTPLLTHDWISAGSVVIAVGSHTPDARELPGELLGRSTVVVESLVPAKHEAGDVIQAVDEGHLDWGDVAVIADWVKEAPVDDSTPIVFKSVGMPWEDLVVSALVFETVRHEHRGVQPRGGDMPPAVMAVTSTQPNANRDKTGKKDGELQFRLANSADAEALVALIESAYRGEGSKGGWTTEADLLGGQRIDVDMARDMLADPDSVVLFAYYDGAQTPVGTVNLRREGEYTYFGTFAVAPQHQGSGLGKHILDMATTIARDQWGSRGFRLTVIRQRTDLVAFYERRGFVSTGKTEPFPYGEPRFGLPKVDDLEFIEMVQVFS